MRKQWVEMELSCSQAAQPQIPNINGLIQHTSRMAHLFGVMSAVLSIIYISRHLVMDG